jgi:hypothetical protein
MPEPILIVAVTTCTLSAIGTGIKIISDIIKRRQKKRNADLEMERKLLPIKVFDSDDECSICLELIDDNCCTLKCSHNFHKECITEWLEHKSICPNCRTDI